MTLLHLYRSPGVSPTHRSRLLEVARQNVSPAISTLDTEYCFNIDATADLEPEEHRVLAWLLAETFEPDRLGPSTFLDDHEGTVLEVGPRMNFTTAWSTNAVSVCHACGLDKVARIERSRRYLLRSES
jgi:phosphoribosylformylglycinamidine synthase